MSLTHLGPVDEARQRHGADLHTQSYNAAGYDFAGRRLQVI